MALLDLLSRVFKSDQLNQFRAQHITALTKLTDLYLSSRYYPREFYREEISELIQVVSELRKLLEYGE